MVLKKLTSKSFDWHRLNFKRFPGLSLLARQSSDLLLPGESDDRSNEVSWSEGISMVTGETATVGVSHAKVKSSRRSSSHLLQ